VLHLTSAPPAAQTWGMSTETDRPVKRPSVPLTGRDLRDLELIRNSPEAMRAAGVPEGASEAALLAAALRAGLEHLREAAQEAGYAALAASYRDDPEEQAVEAAMKRRRPSRRFHTDAES
jgi:hypothetical protein